MMAYKLHEQEVPCLQLRFRGLAARAHPALPIHREPSTRLQQCIRSTGGACALAYA